MSFQTGSDIILMRRKPGDTNLEIKTARKAALIRHGMLARTKGRLSCNDRGHAVDDCDLLAVNLGSVAVIVGRSPQARCNHCAHGLPFIAIRAADDCGSLQLAGAGYAAGQWDSSRVVGTALEGASFMAQLAGLNDPRLLREYCLSHTKAQAGGTACELPPVWVRLAK